MTEKDIRQEFIREFRTLLQKYDVSFSADDCYPGYSECGEDIRIIIEFNGRYIKSIDCGQYIDVTSEMV